MLLVKTISILILSFLLTLFLPWWMITVAAFSVGLVFANKPGNNFLAGGFGVGLFWLGYTLYIDIKDHHHFSGMIGKLFSETAGIEISTAFLVMDTTLIGFVLGGLSCMAGAMILDNGLRRKKAFKTGKYTLKIK